MRRPSPKNGKKKTENNALDDFELARQDYQRIQQHVILENRVKRN